MVTACAATVSVLALTACSSGSSGTAASAAPWSAQSGHEGFVTPTANSSVDSRTDTSDTAWSLHLDKGSSDPNLPTAKWPDATQVLTKAQLSKALPETSQVRRSTCVKGTDGTRQTAKNASCIWQFSVDGDNAGYASSLTVTIVAIGADRPITSAWTTVRDTNFADRKADERFYAQGAFGTKGAYYLDNGQASVLISDGNIAAWIDLRFTGFSTITNWRSTLSETSFPALATDLAAHLPRKYA